MKSFIPKSSRQAWIALGVMVLISACLHIARVSYPAEPVFDEVHFATDAANYVNDRMFFDIHPPLGKLIYASIIPFAHSGSLNNAEFIAPVPNTTSAQYRVTGLPYGTYPYIQLRLIGIFFALCLIVAFYCFLRNVGLSEVAALLAVLFVVFENAILLDTKFILMNSMYLAFGFAALAAWFSRHKYSGLVAGLLLGLSLGVKLMGVVFFAPILVSYFLLQQTERAQFYRDFIKCIAIAIIIFACIVASNFLFFSPHTMINFYQSIGFPIPTPQDAFKTFTTAVYVNTILPWTGYFVQDSGNAAGSSPWYEWPFMQKPMTYYTDPIHDTALTLIGNPIIWYASTLAIIIGLVILIRFARQRPAWFHWAPIIFLGGYVCALAPYLFIHRSTYMYHYFLALLFAISFMAWGLARWFKLESFVTLSRRQWFILAGIATLTIIGFAINAPATYGFISAPSQKQEYTMTLIAKQEHEVFSVNGIKYIVESAKEGSASDGKTSRRFILVEFNATNPTEELITLNEIKVAVLDASGNTSWPVESGVSITPPPGYTLLNTSDTLPTTIDPGATKELFIVSEVAPKAQNLSFVITNLKSESYYVPLGL